MNGHKRMIMPPLYNSQAPKKATNLSINSDLLIKAKELDINLSAALEQALTQLLKKRQRDQWLTDNQEAIAAYNNEVERHGSFSDELRGF
jgi:antitoxin CcdA